MISDLIAEIKTTKKEYRNFGIILGLITLTLGSIMFWKNNSFYSILFTISLIFLTSGLLTPMILKPIYFVWMVLASILGIFMTRLILSIVFYSVLTPIGLVFRIFGKQFIELRWDKSEDSYWNYRTNEDQKKINCERQF